MQWNCQWGSETNPMFERTTHQLNIKPRAADFSEYVQIASFTMLEMMLYVFFILVIAEIGRRIIGGAKRTSFGTLSRGIILSSFGKGFIFLSMIWKYPLSQFNCLLSLFIASSNVIATKAATGSGTIDSILFIAVAQVLRLLFQSLTDLLFDAKPTCPVYNCFRIT
ncbi:hypothetical protein PROFUN_08858 [Planoprotostelium fungivorum]|uniref:Protein ARV n=1 Tax=Planoprotostelium fungivorum TaxID=1890364 RepID=A0A2P6NJ04_9EUKA|nr:hypothetical protein PROFUN_08858 [Planoprotostelium fungivorum]